MAPLTDLNQLLRSMKPKLYDQTYVFISLGAPGDLPSHIVPVGSFIEEEGTTHILLSEDALKLSLADGSPMARITLTVHSSLEAVGLTAAVASALAENGISANVVAAYHHDHVFVPFDRGEQALKILQELSSGAKNM